jgi:Carboxypeptidase regulatory-like domain
MKMPVVKSVCALILCLCTAPMSVAQQSSPPARQNGTIIGTVLDVSGSTVPGARVTLQGPAPNDRRTVVTGKNGFFKFDSLRPATPYRVVVSAQGLENWTSPSVVLGPGQYFILKGITLRLPTLQVTVNAPTIEHQARQQVHQAEKQRIFGFIPNFYVYYGHKPAPLSAKLKFQLAFKTLTDPVTFAGFAFNAGIYQLAGYPSYPQNGTGFAQRLGATFAGGYTNILVGDALLPSLLHQDPRYFYQGTGTTKSRLAHALGSALVTRGDDGRREINYSNIGGDLTSGAVSNAYYPASDRGLGLVLRGALIATGGRMMLGVLQEFVLHKVTSRGKPNQTAGSQPPSSR